MLSQHATRALHAGSTKPCYLRTREPPRWVLAPFALRTRLGMNPLLTTHFCALVLAVPARRADARVMQERA